jgi:hypothetical protein
MGEAMAKDKVVGFVGLGTMGGSTGLSGARALRANLRVIAGLDPAIHPLRKKFLRRGWTRGSSPRVTQPPVGAMRFAYGALRAKRIHV